MGTVSLLDEAFAAGLRGDGPCWTFDEFRLDPHARTLTRNGVAVGLGSRAVELLVVLVEHRGRVVSKEELIRAAWPRSLAADNNLSVAIFALRRAFEGRAYIRNVYGQGYRFVAAVAEVGKADGPASDAAAAELPSIAVLPFTDLGGNGPAQAHFGDGIAEDIIAALSRNRWLTVIARNSSFSFRDGATGVPEIARQLGVRYVLEGSIRHAGGRVRVSAHLNDAEANTHLVSERWDRDLADIFAVQDEITARIVEAVRPALYEAEQDRSFRKRPDSVDAWAAYQRGVWHLARWNAAEYEQASAMFRRAVEIDPRFAPGHYGMASLWLNAGSGHLSFAPADWQKRGEASAVEAVRLDGRDSSAHSTLGSARMLRGDHRGALLATEAALALNPSDAMAHAHRGATLVFNGRPEDGIEALQAFLRLSPRDPRLRVRQMHIGLGLYFMGDFAAAEDHARFMMRHWPDYSAGPRLLGMALAETGRPAEALAAIRRSAAITPEPWDNFSHARMPWYRPEDFRRVLDGFRRVGWTGPGD